MVSSSWCGDNTHAPPGSKGPVAVRPAIVCTQPQTAPIGGLENPARRRFTALATMLNRSIMRSCSPSVGKPGSQGMKGHRSVPDQLSVAGPNPIRQRMGHETLEGLGLSTVLLATTARWSFVLLLARIEDSLEKERQLALECVDLVVQMVDFISGYRSTDDEDPRKDRYRNPHRTSGVWCPWPLHRCLLGIGLRTGGE